MMYLGIAISKNTLDCHKLSDNLSEAKQFKNTSKCIKALVTWVESESHVAIQAKGVYWQACALALHDAGIAVSVVNPAQIKRFGQSKLIKESLIKSITIFLIPLLLKNKMAN